MRYLILLPLLLAGCADPYGPSYGYGGRPYPAYASGYQPGYYGDYGAPPYYAARDPYGSNNCGTPDEPKPCRGRWR